MKPWSIVLLLGLFVFYVSCGRGGNPTSPSSDDPASNGRTGQDFSSAIPIFGTDPPNPLEPPHYHNIDLGQICRGWTPFPEPEYTNACPAVTLERQDNGTLNPFKPRFRLLNSTVPDAGWGPARVADRDVQTPNNRIDYRNPKCEAILDIHQNFIELAVC